jgi:hypothetical protein
MKRVLFLLNGLTICSVIKEPLDVDFYVDLRPLTKGEETKISEYLKANKQRRKNLKTTKSYQSNKNQIVPDDELDQRLRK